METGPRQATVPKTTPCGCITQATETAEGTVGQAKCNCPSCGANCKCAELKGQCDCAHRLEAHETTALAEEMHVPMGCVVEAGVTGAAPCPTCGAPGCKCVETKGSCDCAHK